MRANRLIARIWLILGLGLVLCNCSEGFSPSDTPDIEVVSPPLTGDPPVYQLNFENVAVGVLMEQQVVVANIGNAELRIMQLNFEAGGDVDDFSIPQAILASLPLVIEPGGQTTIDVTYQASDGTNDHGVLDIISNDPDEALVQIHLLSEFKGEQEAVLSPGSLDFGDITVGQSSQPLSFTISNQGTGNAVLSVEDVRFGVLANQDFDLEVRDADMQPVELPALVNIGDLLDVEVTYHPQVAEDDSDEVVVISNDPLSPSLSVTLSGRGVVGSVGVEPSSLDMGRVRVDELGELAATITNTGGADLELTGVVLSGVNEEWTLSSNDMNLDDLADDPYSMSPGDWVGIDLSFAPVDIGQEGGQLVIDHTGPGDQLVVSISAEGYIPPALELVPDPTDLQFGDVQLDQATTQYDSRTLQVTIRNIGGEPLEISAIQRATGTSQEFTWQPVSIPPIDVGQEAVLNVTFQPDNTGLETGLILVDTNDPDIELEDEIGRFGIDLQGRGIDPTIFVWPTSHNFGNAYIGELKTVIITVHNATVDPLVLNAVRLTAGSSPAFSLHELPMLPTEIPDTATEVTFEAHYQPTAVGPASGALEIVSSDIGNPVVTVILQGTCSDCPAGFSDCDEDPGNGCETPLNTLTDCGGCDIPCDLPHASETCADGTCELVACDDGYNDCTSAPGCETQLGTDTDCSACDNDCTDDYPHAAGECQGGSCQMGACDSGWDDCDVAPGCETQLGTDTDCSACNDDCTDDYPHADGFCSGDSCQMGACDSGYTNCDGSDATGCEVTIVDDYPDSWSGPTIGSYPDATSGTISGQIAPSGDEDFMAVWASEEYDQCASIKCRVRLINIPAGEDYDLCACWTGSSECDITGWVCSTNAGSSDETVMVELPEEGCIWPIGNGTTEEGYCDIRVYGWVGSNNACQNYQIVWEVWE